MAPTLKVLTGRAQLVLLSSDCVPSEERGREDLCTRLLRRLLSCLVFQDPYYVRCIKPNEMKSPVLFDDARCQHQVAYLGLMENVRVRRAGFAYRQHYARVLQR